MMKFMTIAGFVILGLIAIALVFLAYGRLSHWSAFTGPLPAASYDFATAERSQTANDALGCSPGLCTADDGLTLPAWSIAPADLLTALDDSLTGIDPLAQRIDDRSDPLRARYVTFSPGLRFPDLIDIQVSPLAENRSGVEIYSRARLGKLDFGANRARIEALIAALPQGLTE